MGIIPLIIQAIGGAVGGNLTGKLFKGADQGWVANSVAGIVGGGLGGQVLNSLGVFAMPSGSLDIGAILGNIASGGVGGGIILAIIGLIAKIFKK